MSRSISVPDDSFRAVQYAVLGSALTGAVLVLLSLYLDGGGDAATVWTVVFFGSVALLGLWRAYTGGGWTHTGRADDITYRPYSDPQQMARDNWRQAVRWLPRDDDDEDDDEE